jgi:hypothetical protein
MLKIYLFIEYTLFIYTSYGRISSVRSFSIKNIIFIKNVQFFFYNKGTYINLQVII